MQLLGRGAAMAMGAASRPWRRYDATDSRAGVRKRQLDLLVVVGGETIEAKHGLATKGAVQRAGAEAAAVTSGLYD